MAANNVAAIERLVDEEGFKMVTSILKDRADQLADSILHDDDLSSVDREAFRQRRLGILEALKAPKEIHDGGTNVMRVNGGD